MIKSQDNDRTRTRPFTLPEVARAIARTVEQPARNLTTPDVIRLTKPTDAAQPAAELVLPDGGLSSVTAWAQVMDPIESVTVIGGTSDATYVLVTGRLPGGPTVTVVCWVDDMPLDVRVWGGQKITLPELAALAAGTIELPVPAVVGAR